MEHLNDKLGAIMIKAKQLALKIERLESENTVLKKQIKQLKAGGAKTGKVLIEKKVSKKQGQSDLEEYKQLKKEVAQYIKEIDKCIEMVKEV